MKLYKESVIVLVSLCLKYVELNTNYRVKKCRKVNSFYYFVLIKYRL